MKVLDMDLTPEQECKLKSFLPIKPVELFRYTPRVYRELGLPKETWPVFELMPLSGMETVEAEDAMHGAVVVDQKDQTGSVSIQRGKFTAHVCRRGVRGWRNYRDLATGEEIPFDISRLPKDLLYELSNVILENARMTEEELRGLR